MRFLVIYENVPETTDLFLVDTKDSLEMDELGVIHNHYINNEDDDRILDICTKWYYKLYGEVTWANKEEYNKYGVVDQDLGKYLKNKIDAIHVIDVQSFAIDRIVITGFIC